MNTFAMEAKMHEKIEQETKGERNKVVEIDGVYIQILPMNLQRGSILVTVWWTAIEGQDISVESVKRHYLAFFNREAASTT